MPSKIITSDRDRSRIIDAYENGEDFVSLALSLDIKRTTAYEIIRTKQRTGQTNAVRGKGGRSSVIDNETIDLIVLLIEENPLITLRSMVAEVREVWPEKTHFSTTTVARVLEGELYSVKMTRDIPAARNSDEVKEARHQYAEWLTEGLTTLGSYNLFLTRDI